MRSPGAGLGPSTRSASGPRPAKRSESRTSGPESSTTARNEAARAWPKQKDSRSDAKNRRGRNIGDLSKIGVGEGCKDLIRGLNDAAVHFIGALRGNEIGDLGDVGGFDKTLHDGAETRGAGHALDRVSRGRRGEEHIAALRRKTGRVGERDNL